MKIGVFDSGLGGLSIVRAIRTLMPNDDILYVGDTAYVPWGGRPESWIEQRSSQISQYLIDCGADAIVVACNTATAHAVQSLRERFSVPIIGVEPPIKPACAFGSRKVLVLATERTFQSTRFHLLVERYALGRQLLLRASPDLVEVVEAGKHDAVSTIGLLQAILEPCMNNTVDAVVLGCTHFSWLRPAMERLALGRFSIFDPALAVANRVQGVLVPFSKPPGRESGISLLFSSDMAARVSLLDILMQGESYELGRFELTQSNGLVV